MLIYDVLIFIWCPTKKSDKTIIYSNSGVGFHSGEAFYQDSVYFLLYFNFISVDILINRKNI